MQEDDDAVLGRSVGIKDDQELMYFLSWAVVYSVNIRQDNVIETAITVALDHLAAHASS